MSVHDELGKRMKEFYEKPAQTKLIRRMPVALRIDGKSFHTFTQGFQRPFDSVLMTSMQNTMKYLCENIQGCVFGYTQSDEITLILVDYQTLTTASWFDYEVQKLCSVTASMATMAFNRFFEKEYAAWRGKILSMQMPTEEAIRLRDAYLKAINTGALFDARCFNIPKEEVCNLIYWRQLDATRNSIQMVGQANFSHAELQNKSCDAIQDMLLTQKNINWNYFSTACKRGTACFKKSAVAMTPQEKLESVNRWYIDTDMPILKNEDRDYVEKHLYLNI